MIAEALIVVVILAVGGGLVWSRWVAAKRRQAVATARWEAIHETMGGVTHVLCVRHGARLEVIRVDKFPDTAADWDDRLHTAMAAAREKAAAANSERR